MTFARKLHVVSSSSPGTPLIKLSRHISVQELRDAIAVGEVMQDHPDDKYGPSCLVFGFTLANRPLHIRCSDPSRPLVKIITLYEPDPRRWVDFKVRRPADEQ